jgi:hypothetical protein
MPSLDGEPMLDRCADTDAVAPVLPDVVAGDDVPRQRGAAARLVRANTAHLP